MDEDLLFLLNKHPRNELRLKPSVNTKAENDK